MISQEPVNAIPVKKNRTPLIIAAPAIALCCLCLGAAVAGYWGFITVRTVGTPVIPIEEFITLIPENPETPSRDQNSTSEPPGIQPGVGNPPSGGLGNDILRNDTWQVIAPAAMGKGCDRPIGANSTIDVLQEPDANGVWLEKWTVVCRSGDSYAFEVEYILDATGATFNIRSIP